MFLYRDSAGSKTQVGNLESVHKVDRFKHKVTMLTGAAGKPLLGKISRGAGLLCGRSCTLSGCSPLWTNTASPSGTPCCASWPSGSDRTDLASCRYVRGAFDSAKNHKRQSVTAKREKSQTLKFVQVRLG